MGDSKTMINTFKKLLKSQALDSHLEIPIVKLMFRTFSSYKIIDLRWVWARKYWESRLSRYLETFVADLYFTVTSIDIIYDVLSHHFSKDLKK